MSAYIITVLSIVGGAISVYVAASFTLAQKQLLAATRLQAYLLHYARLVNDWKDAYIIIYLGAEWDKEEQAIIQRGGTAQELVNLSDEKKKLWDQISEAATKTDVVPDDKFAEMAQTLKKFKRSDVQWMTDALKVGRQNMLTGQTFITDEEASHLGVYMANNVIALKMGIIELMDGFTFLVVKNVDSDEPIDSKRFTQSLIKLLWRLVVVSRDYYKLQRETRRFTNSSIVMLTFRNIRQGSRFTKR